MGRLLSVERSLMLGSKIVKITPLLAVMFGCFTAIELGLSGSVWSGAHSYLMMWQFVPIGIGSMLLTRDFTDNTIRSKLIAGHTRLNIYLSKQIVFSLFALITSALFIGSYILAEELMSNMNILSNTALDAESANVLKRNFMNALPTDCLAVPAITSLAVFISMTAQNSAGAMLSIIAINALLIFPMLSESFPESGVLSAISWFLPMSQVFMGEVYAAEAGSSAIVRIVGSAVFAAVMIAGGCAVFRKKDLN